MDVTCRQKRNTAFYFRSIVSDWSGIKKMIKENFKTASQHLPIAEPIDWLKTLCQKNGN